jgi:hypothetical protein
MVGLSRQVDILLTDSLVYIQIYTFFPDYFRLILPPVCGSLFPMADLPAHPTDATAQADEKKPLPSKEALAKAERAAKKERAKAERVALRVEAKEEKKQSRSLAKMAEAKILKDLSSSLETHARSATFACGGTVSSKPATEETVEETSKESAQKGNATVNPKAKAKAKDSEQPSATIDDVQVRFGSSGKGYTVVFNKGGPSWKDFTHLLMACQPASFGRTGEAVLDEEYLKAGKLDRSQFATTFCPYEAGIIDVVTQLLVPQYKHDKHTRSIKVTFLLLPLTLCSIH